MSLWRREITGQTLYDVPFGVTVQEWIRDAATFLRYQKLAEPRVEIAALRAHVVNICAKNGCRFGNSRYLFV